MFNAIGKPIPRYDGLGHVTGRTIYVSDVTMPGTLTCKVLRCPYHRARIVSLDVTQAKRMPGVYGVITREDVPYNRFAMVPDNHVLAEEITRYRGQPVAAVAAVSKEAALDALAKIKVEYEELEPVFDPEKAMEPDAPQIRPEGNVHLFDGTSPVRRVRRGDIEKGFAEADVIVEGRYTTPCEEHAPLECCSTLAYVDESGKLVLYSKTQGVYFVMGDLANVFQLPMNKLKFIGNTIGGSFGSGNSVATDHIAGLLALKTGKPVRYTLTRAEEMMFTTISTPWIFKIKDGVRRDGKITARHVEVIHDCGAFTELGLYAAEKNANLVAGANLIENLAVDTHMVFTNKLPSGSRRGFGVNVGQFAEQVQLDRDARAVGISPMAIRFINAFHEDDISHVGNRLRAVSTIETLQGVADLAGISLEEQYRTMSSKEVEK
ncbi:xanthine dehydrogenase family protein molybdopterin-binding subunit [Pseudoflavonifractor gallinarum]|uniref:Xanthine dehydrogenase family protein molybdopterin-binding subunit n=1 Tax=Pseudoflavonifractor hominis TaxID=2763059 RepID=A0ABR7HNW8_9FIRM|nr:MULTISPECIES: molybdopterin cofactor-binding domain-containing protein [Eubacteriales]MBC5729223.1 xanthine dehydrogenase family protein molybdopterin-binding subunit [Pseudoflavonifractor hominis]MBS5135991.1 xanthine dehydrogenase family protein molybdopterin-binding subunit [Oscillospiraceae bacterium]